MSKPVLGTGPLDCKIAIIGETPVQEEWKADKLLTELLPRGSIVGSACYQTKLPNIFKPKNPKPYPTKEYENGVESLRHQLGESTANIFVLLGNTPLYALTDKTGITKWRGSILESNLLCGRKVIPTIHPSTALHEYIFGRVITHDLLRAARESEFPEIRRPSYELEIFPSFDRACDYLNSVLHSTLSVAVDIEVLGNEVKCIGFSASNSHAFCIPFTSQGRDYFTPHQEADIWALVGKIIEHPDIPKIFQNGMFDLTFMFERYGIVPQNLEDTMIAHAILYPDFRHGLDFITSIYTDHPYYKDEGKQWNKLYIDEKSFFEYNAKDCIVCFEAMPKLLEELEKQGNTETYRRQMKLTSPMMFMQSRGIRLDLDGMQHAKEKAAEDIKALTKRLHEEAGCELNPQSPKQVQTFFYVKKGYTPYTTKGKISCDETALKRLARKGAKEASTIIEIRGIAKMLGTYLDVDLDDDNRLRGSFRLMTANGRVSSGKNIFGKGGNMQNQPPEMMQYFLADEGMLFVHIDLSQAENRIVARIAPEPAMCRAFDEGQDVHALTGALISGLTVEEVSRQHKAKEFCSLGTGDNTWRMIGKTCNHALNYGLGYKTFALRYEYQESEAKKLVEAYHHAYPGIRYGYHDYVQHQLKNTRTLKNPYGRHRLFLDRWGDSLFQEAYAYTPQSSVADKMWKDGIIPIYENQEEYGCVALSNNTHDSIDFQIPLSAGTEKIASTVNSIIERLEIPMQWRATEIHIPCDVSIGFNLENTESLSHKIHEPITPDMVQAALNKMTNYAI